MSAAGDREPVVSGSRAYFDCVDFVHLEAELLDGNRLREWFELVDPEIDYRVPIRVTRERAAGAGFSVTGWHMLETYGSIETRIERLETEYAWAEDPPSRTRRFVSNIRVSAGVREDELAVRTNLLLYRGRYDAPEHQLVVAEREDVLRRVGGGLRLLRRLVLLEHATLPTHNLAVFL